MKERRYKEDYKLEEYIDERGRERRRAVYCGPQYRMDDRARSSLVKQSVFCAAAFVLFYLAYMKLSTPSAYCMAVLPVAACAVIPFVYWCMGTYTLWRVPLCMTRLQKETGAGRILRSAAACMCLIGMACAADLVFMIVSLGAECGAEIPGFILLLCAAGSAVAAFRCARRGNASIVQEP